MGSLFIRSVSRDLVDTALKIIDEHGCSVVGVISKVSNKASEITDPIGQRLAEAMNRTIEQGSVFIVIVCIDDKQVDKIDKKLEELESKR